MCEIYEYYELYCGVSFNVKLSWIFLEMFFWVVIINVDYILVIEFN